MTKQDDAFLNLGNPLRLRAAANGGGPMVFGNMDSNFLNLMRAANEWDVARVPYLKNEVVYFHGFLYIAAIDTPNSPLENPTEWTPMTGISGLGGMRRASPGAGQSITASWATFVGFDSLTSAERGVTSDPANDQFSFQYSGLWDLNFELSFEHDSNPSSGRTFFLRAYNITKDIAGSGVAVGIGRSSEATHANVGIRHRVPENEVGDFFRIEIGNGDVVTVDNYFAAELDFTQIAV